MNIYRTRVFGGLVGTTLRFVLLLPKKVTKSKMCLGKQLALLKGSRIFSFEIIGVKGEPTEASKCNIL